MDGKLESRPFGECSKQHMTLPRCKCKGSQMLCMNASASKQLMLVTSSSQRQAVAVHRLVITSTATGRLQSSYLLTYYFNSLFLIANCTLGQN